MRLADFIRDNTEAILQEWDAFARRIWPATTEVDPAELRDHAEAILQATAHDMQSPQTATEQTEKSQGSAAGGAGSGQVNTASAEHAAARVRSGFDLLAVVSEYRALRASVLRLWRDTNPGPDRRDVDDITRFNESIDQSLSKAVDSFAEQVRRSRQMFLAILGHDLRNPLNSIKLSADVISMTEQSRAQSLELASQISTSASAMGQMIRDLLDFTGAELGGAIPVSPAPMDLAKLCREVVEEMRGSCPDRSLQLSVRGNLNGQWDTARLRQLVSNLIGNAIQHGSGPIDCSASEEGAGVRLAVANQGAPIPPDLLPTIFDPMVRGSSSTGSHEQKQRGSLGLGLYIARAIASAHGGTIEVQSSPENGTVFTVRLPRQMKPHAG
jgi:signal transduction histidine kinase